MDNLDGNFEDICMEIRAIIENQLYPEVRAKITKQHIVDAVNLLPTTRKERLQIPKDSFCRAIDDCLLNDKTKNIYIKDRNNALKDVKCDTLSLSDLRLHFDLQGAGKAYIWAFPYILEKVNEEEISKDFLCREIDIWLIDDQKRNDYIREINNSLMESNRRTVDPSEFSSIFGTENVEIFEKYYEKKGYQ